MANSTGSCGSLDIILDIAYKRVESAAEDKRELDNKVSILLAANGVLLGFLASAWGNLYGVLGAHSLFFIILSATFCILALKNRPYQDWKIEGAWSNYQPFGEDVDGLKTQIISDLNAKDKTNSKNIEDIGKNYSRALFTFEVSLILAAISLTLSLFLPNI